MQCKREITKKTTYLCGSSANHQNAYNHLLLSTYSYQERYLFVVQTETIKFC